MNFLKKAVVAGLMLFGVSGVANAVPLSGGSTVVQVDQGIVGALTGAGIAPGPVDPAIVNGNGFFQFNITGGDLDPTTLVGSIEHDGGVSLTEMTVGTATATNFLIQIGAGGVGSILGDISLNGMLVQSDVALFDFDLSAPTPAGTSALDLAAPGLALLIAADFADTLETVFGLGGLQGVLFGLAATAPEFSEVPVPAALPLFVAGLAGMRLMRRRRAATA